MNIISLITRPFSSNGAAAVASPATTASRVGERARQTLEAQGNGDFILTKWRSGLYAFVDLVGGIRQTGATVEATSRLMRTAAAVSRIAGAVIPFGLLVTGPMMIGSMAAWGIPDSYTALQSANNELTKATTSGNLIQEAKRAVLVARLGLANMGLAFGMGVAQTVSGATMMITPDVARVLHYAPLLSGHIATVALAVTNVALGAVYTLRGGVMVARTVKSYIPVAKMRKAFKKVLKQSPHDALGFLTDEEAKGTTYFERRVDPNCLEYVGEDGEVAGKYTSKGIVNFKGGTVKNDSNTKREYLRRVDKGIYTQILKHRVALIIGGAMILGGITAIALAFMTGGIAPIVIALASAVFFIGMEYLFLVYDSTALFNKLRDWTYVPSPELESLNRTLLEEPSWLSQYLTAS